jgi:hypothetical protein
MKKNISLSTKSAPLLEVPHTLVDPIPCPEPVYSALVLVDFHEIIEYGYPHHIRQFYDQLGLYLDQNKEICIIGNVPEYDWQNLLNNTPTPELRDSIKNARITRFDSYEDVSNHLNHFGTIAIGGSFKEACVSMAAIHIADHVESDFVLPLLDREASVADQCIQKCVISSALSLSMYESRDITQCGKVRHELVDHLGDPEPIYDGLVMINLGTFLEHSSAEEKTRFFDQFELYITQGKPVTILCSEEDKESEFIALYRNSPSQAWRTQYKSGILKFLHDFPDVISFLSGKKTVAIAGAYKETELAFGAIHLSDFITSTFELPSLARDTGWVGNTLPNGVISDAMSISSLDRDQVTISEPN